MLLKTTPAKFTTRLLTIFLAAIALLTPATSFAWGSEGHRLIALLALEHLSPATRAELNRLLALEGGATLASISTWADHHRSRSTAAWHYVNLPEDDCHYVESRDCPDGKCVVAAIERQVEKLRTAKSDEERLLALKYIVHLVADVHQPLHAGHQHDKGGNKFQVRAFGRGTNLHALWDSDLIEERLGGAALMLHNAQGMPAPARTMNPAAWAEESCQIVQTEGFYPSSRKVGLLYALRWDVVLRQRLSDAAYRLAWTLDKELRD